MCMCERDPIFLKLPIDPLCQCKSACESLCVLVVAVGPALQKINICVACMWVHNTKDALFSAEVLLFFKSYSFKSHICKCLYPMSETADRGFCS